MEDLYGHSLAQLSVWRVDRKGKEPGRFCDHIPKKQLKKIKDIGNVNLVCNFLN
jgi:hypothetical protein